MRAQPDISRHRPAYSWRARLGLIVPPTNTVNEAEWRCWMPPGVTFHTTRMALHTDTSSKAGQAALWRDLGAALDLLVPVSPDIIAYGCTAGSMVSPPEQLPAAMRALAGLPCTSTALAIVQALRALGATRIAVATPYHDALNDHEIHFLAGCGISVLNLVGLGIGAGGPGEYVRIARTPIAAVAAHVRRAMVPGAQALLISCTDFPTLALIAELEAEFGVSVISSNSATLWACLRGAGIADTIAGAGHLLTLPGLTLPAKE